METKAKESDIKPTLQRYKLDTVLWSKSTEFSRTKLAAMTIRAQGLEMYVALYHT